MERGKRALASAEADAAYSKAAKAEFSGNYDLAFRSYIKSAELFLHLSRSSPSQNQDKEKWRTNAGKALERAERIKSFSEGAHRNASPTLGSAGALGASTSSSVLTPVGINQFSPQEQFFVLNKGGRVNGLTFPLWDEPLPRPVASLPFKDPDGQPPLSPQQNKGLPVWKRPEDSVRGVGHSAPTELPQILPQDIVQHIVTDCSVCASISVCLEHSRKFGSNLARSSLHLPGQQSQPRRTTNLTVPDSTPAVSGQFHLRLLFNGAWRRITIDDTLPYHPTDGTLMCMSVNNPPNLSTEKVPPITRLWPSFLEKGYMKLMGGYDFPGSNSSIDLHALTGWIPEHIDVRSSSFERERTWKRILDGFTTGQCVLTLGTGPCTSIFWRNFKLLESHSYAVIDAVENEAYRGLTVLDSWINNDQHDSSRILQMPWTDVLDVFDGLYLNWDPTSWPCRETFHGMWKRAGSDDFSSSHQLRLHYKSTKSDVDAQVWALLTRHVTDTRKTSDYISLRVQVQDGLLASAHNFGGQRVLTTKGTFTNGTHVLARVRVSRNQPDGVFSIHPSYDGPSAEIGYTLTVYAPEGMALTWDDKVTDPPYSSKVDGTFTTKSSGGNCTYPTFMFNPQYRLHIRPKSAVPGKVKVALSIQTNRDLPVNVVVTWSQGARVTELSEKDIAATSGAYSYGLARTHKELQAGDYTVVVSTFEPQQTGPFSLRVESSSPFDLVPIPQEGAGMYTKSICGTWEKDTAGGSPSFRRYMDNPIFEIEVPSLTQIKIRVQLVGQALATPLNATIYPAGTGKVVSRQIATSEGYDDAISGVVIPEISLGAGKYWLIASTYNPDFEATFQIIVYSSIANVKISQK